MADLDKLTITIEIDEQSSKKTESRLDSILDKLKSIDALAEKHNLGDSFNTLTAKIQSAETKLSHLEKRISEVQSGLKNISAEGIKSVGDEAKKTTKSVEGMAKWGSKDAFNFAKNLTDAERLRMTVEALSQKLAEAKNQGKSGDIVGNIAKRLQKATAEWENVKRQTALVVADTERSLMVIDNAVTTTRRLGGEFSEVATEVQEATKSVKQLFEETNRNFILRGDPYKSRYNYMDLTKNQPKMLPEGQTPLLLTGKVGDAYDKIIEGANNVKSSIGSMFSELKGNIGSIANAIGSGVGGIVGNITSIAGKVGAVFSKVMLVINAVITAVRTVISVVKKVYQVLTKVFNMAKKVAGAFVSLAETVGELALNIGKISLVPFTPVIKGLQSAYNFVDKILKKIMKMVKMRIYRLIAKSIVNGFAEGLKNAYHFSQQIEERFAESMDRIATAHLYLKNSLGALAMPILNILAPAIDFLVDKFVTLLNVINQLIARLSGQSSWTRAVKYPTEFASSLDDATSSAKALEKELITILGIDEINPMEGLDDNGSGSGSGAGAGTDYLGMFEEQTDYSEGVKRLTDKLKDAWARADFTEIGAIIGEKLRDALENIPWVRIKNTAERIGSSIATFLNGAVSTPNLFKEIGETISEGLNTSFKLVYGFVSRFDWSNTGKAVAEGINGFMSTLDWETIKKSGQGIGLGLANIVNNAVSNITWTGENSVAQSMANGFNTVVNSFANFIKTIDIGGIGSSIASFIMNGVANINWTGNNGVADAIGSGINNAFNGINRFLEGIDFVKLGKQLGETINKIVKKVNWDEVGRAIGNGLQGALDFIGSLVDELDVEEVRKALEEMLEQIPIKEIMVQVWDITNGLIQDIIDIILFGTKERKQDYLDAISLSMGDSTMPEGQYDEFGNFISAPTGKKQGLVSFLVDKISFKAGLLKNGEYPLPTSSNIIGVSVNDPTRRFLLDTGLPTVAMMMEAKDKIPQNDKTIGGLKGIFGQSVIGRSFNTVIDTIANFTSNRKGSSWSDIILGLVASFGSWERANSFLNVVGGMSAQFGGWSKASTFGTVVSGMTSEFKTWSKGSTFGAVVGGMTSEFAKRTLGKNFNSTITGMKSEFSKRGVSRDFNSTITGMTANFSKRTITGDALKPITITANITKLTSDVKGGLKITPVAKGGAFYGGNWHNIPQFASGGMPSHGSMFIAGENGTELVGRIGGRTEVLNQSQMASTMYSAVLGANASQNRLLEEQNTLLREMLSKQGSQRAYVTTSDLADGFRLQNMRNGRTVIPMGV